MARNYKAFATAQSLHTGIGSPIESSGSSPEDGSVARGASSSAGEHALHTGGVGGSIPSSRTATKRTTWARIDHLAVLLAQPLLAESVAQRFWRNVDKGAPDDCWPWLGGSKNGYGHFKLVSYVTVGAHRCAYAFGQGQSPGRMLVCHRCDNPPCCNPDHLFLGTDADNTHDMLAKGRWRSGDHRGEQNGYAKVTAAQVETIRRRILAGETNVAIAADYGVTHQAISRIRRGKSWGEPAMQPKYASLKGRYG